MRYALLTVVGVLVLGAGIAAPLVVPLGATGATDRTMTDVFIFGKVTGRVPGKNAARVAITWDFKCLGDKLGTATYRWTLVGSTLDEDPARSVTFGSGESKKGSLSTVLAPGRWQLRGDPFLCQTERGAGSTAPEVGQVVTVPDYCAWRIAAAKGVVEVEAGGAVRRGTKGASVSPPVSVSTAPRGAATLVTAGREATIVAGPSTRALLVRGACTSSPPQVTLEGGSARVRASRAGKVELRVRSARVTGRNASWTVVVKRGTVTVKGSKGTVVVRGATGKALTLRSGGTAVVSGRSAPRRG